MTGVYLQKILAERLGLCSLADFSEGYIGKLQIRKSGHTQLVLGNVALDVTMGTPAGFLQVNHCLLLNYRAPTLLA